MKILTLLVLGVVNFSLLFLGLIFIYFQIKEVFNQMTKQEKELNDKLDALTTAVGSVKNGTTQILGKVGELQAEVAALKEANPDLEDEIAKIETLTGEVTSIASAIDSAFPQVPDARVTDTATEETVTEQPEGEG